MAHAARRARQLSWLSLAWMGAEGALAITAGVLAGSIALLSFGLDSVIEAFASLVIVWRFTGSRLLSHAAEERAQKLVASTRGAHSTFARCFGRWTGAWLVYAVPTDPVTLSATKGLASRVSRRAG